MHYFTGFGCFCFDSRSLWKCQWMPLGMDFLALAGKLLDTSQMLKSFHHVEFNQSQLTQSRYPTKVTK